MRSFGCGASDVGAVRENNEDRFLVDDDLGMYVVCDGMGGHAAGEVAAQEAIEAARGSVRSTAGEMRKVARGDASGEKLVELSPTS